MLNRDETSITIPACPAPQRIHFVTDNEFIDKPRQKRERKVPVSSGNLVVRVDVRNVTSVR